MTSKPIADYAVIGNCRTAALVARDGSIDWWCAPRFDSPALFARLLDARAGHFKIAPPGSLAVTRRYLEGSLVLETTMVTETGTLVITDALAFGPHENGHEIGSTAPALMLRALRCTAGSVEVEVELAPRPEYGLVSPLVQRAPGGAVFRGGAELLRFSLAREELELSNGTLRARFTLHAGRTCALALESVEAAAPIPKAWRESDIVARIERTCESWRSWSDLHQSYTGDYREHVHLGGRVLQGLTYQPTGAIVAAATTSLPETAGGTLNWDYRFSWIRDASLTMQALWVAACPDEAKRYFDWLAATASGTLRDGELQVVFGVRGDYDLSERELPHLCGWRGSRPVRVGNAAWTQRQLDVYGEIAGAAFRFRDQLASFAPATRSFVVDAIERAAEHWQQPDHGIWEQRDAPAHYVHSKLMCWQALEAGIALADRLDVRDRVERWAACRDEIDAAIRTRGWNAEKNAYVQTFDGSALDASALLMPLSGFLSPNDPRARATVEAIARELCDGSLVRRYEEDGNGGSAFVICSFWLAHARAVIGDVEAARETFEAALAAANDVGLFSEEIDLATREQLGNVPQAFSHVGLINAAAAIDAAEKQRTGVS